MAFAITLFGVGLIFYWCKTGKRMDWLSVALVVAITAVAQQTIVKPVIDTLGALATSIGQGLGGAAGG